MIDRFSFLAMIRPARRRLGRGRPMTNFSPVCWPSVSRGGIGTPRHWRTSIVGPKGRHHLHILPEPQSRDEAQC